MNIKRKYDSTIARMAGNILSGVPMHELLLSQIEDRVRLAVAVARAVIKEVERTEPEIVHENELGPPQALPRGPA